METLGDFLLCVPTGPASAVVSKLPLWVALIVSLGTLVPERAFMGSHENSLLSLCSKLPCGQEEAVL